MLQVEAAANLFFAKLSPAVEASPSSSAVAPLFNSDISQRDIYTHFSNPFDGKCHIYKKMLLNFTGFQKM